MRVQRPTPELLERLLSQAAARHFARSSEEDVEVTLLEELGTGERGFVLTVGDDAVRVVVEEVDR